ncbi:MULTISPECIES: acyl carrier protein [unclassified Sutcliffiella]|uniref:acyl carrier protein n=1 Tax=unclassified Sutcliffiella TaxID=2837532 RepID=UPI0030D50284
MEMKLESNTEKKILNILGDILEIEDFKIDVVTNLSTIGLDSLSAIKTLIKIEEVFSIELDDADLIIENAESISKLVLLVKKYSYRG